MSGNSDPFDPRDAWLPPRPTFWPLLRESGLGRRLLVGLPALALGTGVLVVAAAAASIDQGHLRAHYFQEAVRHFHARDYQAARLGFERIVDWDGPGGDPEVRFDLAVSLSALGETGRAAALVEPMAPDDRPGYAPAHVWKACCLWAGNKHTPADVRAGEQHLLMAHQLAPGAIEVNALLGQFYLAAGSAGQAVPFLEKAAPDRPELLLPLARACMDKSDVTVGRHWAREARRIFRRRVEANLDDHASRLRWAEADLILEDFAEAAQVLQREVEWKRDARYPRALAEVLLAWSDALARKDPANLAGRLGMLERGLALNPASITLLGRFSDLIRAGGPEGDRARAALLDLQARGLATGPVRYALGLDAWEHGRVAEARLHWEAACRLMPQIPAFVNNLAWILANGPDPDLPRALATINPLVERFPADRRLRETRGEILAKLKRWKEALPDLAAAVLEYPDDANVHRMLAETYDQLDAPGLSAEHRKRAAAAESRPAAANEVQVTPGPFPGGPRR
jgi:tetratricopeptide (TPR) repeat protein